MTNQATQLKPLTESQLYAAAHNMERMGGGFAGAIAEAFFLADSSNRATLVQAFDSLFRRYSNV